MSFLKNPIQVYCDSADLTEVRHFARQDTVSGFTTNPTIFRAQGIESYLEASKQLTEAAFPKEVSLEVIADENQEMLRQARILRSLGNNTYIKIPITNTKGESTAKVVEQLLKDGIPVNLTAVFTLRQIQELPFLLKGDIAPLIISVFAGRLADIGQDAESVVGDFVRFKSQLSENCRILWASPREVFNVIQASRCGCDIITLTPEFIKKMLNFGKDPELFSLETVKMFATDAVQSGYSF